MRRTGRLRQHNNPMEPHATVASWEGDQLTLFDSNQGPSRVARVIAGVFGLRPDQVRVITEHVGGGFGGKGQPRPSVVLAALAARVVRLPVKLAVTRRQMFAVVGHRTPTIQRVRLAARPDGQLTAIAHDVIEQSSTLKEFAEQTAVATRHMYAAANRSTSHRLVRLDVPTPSWMRAPGECPGMFALESAMDELALACGVDPVELRIRNEPAADPETGLPFSSRNLVACLREGAARFGWADRDPAPGVRRDGRWLTGTGMAASTYPALALESQARAEVDGAGRYRVSIAAVDIGTGARTALLVDRRRRAGRPAGAVTMRIGDSSLPEAMVAGGSMGTASWSWAVVGACRSLRGQIGAHDGPVPPEGLPPARHRGDIERCLITRGTRSARSSPRSGGRRHRGGPGTPAPRCLRRRAHRQPGHGPVAARRRHDHGALDGPVRGEPGRSRVRRLHRRDLASYHVAVNPDVGEVEAYWVDEDEPNSALPAPRCGRGRHRRHRGRHRQRGAPRNGRPGARPADPPRQTAPLRRQRLRRRAADRAENVDHEDQGVGPLIPAKA